MDTLFVPTEFLDQKVKKDADLRGKMLPCRVDRVQCGFDRVPVIQSRLQPACFQVALDIETGDQTDAEARAQRIAHSKARRDRISSVDGDPLGATVLAELPYV